MYPDILIRKEQPRFVLTQISQLLFPVVSKMDGDILVFLFDVQHEKKGEYVKGRQMFVTPES